MATAVLLLLLATHAYSITTKQKMKALIESLSDSEVEATHTC